MKKSTFLFTLFVAAATILGGCNSDEEAQGGSITVEGLGSFNVVKANQIYTGYDAERNLNKIMLTLESSNSSMLEANFFIAYPNPVIAAGRYSVAANTLSGTFGVDSTEFEFDNTTISRVTTTNSKTNYSITLNGKTTTGAAITMTYNGKIPQSSTASVGTGVVSLSARDSSISTHEVSYAWQSSVKTPDNHCRQCFDMLVKDNIKVAVTITYTTDIWMDVLQNGATIGQANNAITTCKVFHGGAWESLVSGEMQLTRDSEGNYIVTMNDADFGSGRSFSFSYSGTLGQGGEWEVNKVD